MVPTPPSYRRCGIPFWTAGLIMILTIWPGAYAIRSLPRGCLPLSLGFLLIRVLVFVLKPLERLNSQFSGGDSCGPGGSVYMFATFRYSMAGNSARFFFILSGEHPTLPLAEVKAILHAYAIKHEIVGSFYKLIEIEADRAKLESIASRGAYVDEMGEELLHTEDNLESIKREVEFANLEPFLTSEDSFSVRMLRF